MSDFYSWLEEALEREYEPVRLLKESQRGSVRLLRHLGTGKLAILRRFTGSAEVYRKLRESRCPHLPLVYEVASREGRHLELEEYIQGDNLGFLLRDSLFTAEETRRVVRQVYRALWVLHSIGAVHRDVKPYNIFLRGDQAVLIDFDAALLHKPEHDSDTQVLGTTGFAAPEQYGLSQSDPRSDIYAVGILLNVMLTGEHPSRRLAAGHLGRVVERCTRIDPGKRYRNVAKLMGEL